jgi:hypothetical protein
VVEGGQLENDRVDVNLPRMKRWRGWAVYLVVATVQFPGCGSSSNNSPADASSNTGSTDPNAKRCQATCTQFCQDPFCKPCSVDDCVALCLGYTDGLEATCAQCIISSPGYGGGSAGIACSPEFKSPGDPECLPLCATQGDAGTK